MQIGHNTPDYRLLKLGCLSIATLFSLGASPLEASADGGSSGTTTGTTTVISTNQTNGLEVGQGGTIIIDFGTLGTNSKNSTGTLNITGGAFNNKGTVYLISTNPNITTGVLNLSGNNVNNFSIITSANIPSSLLASLNLINLVSNFNFSFTGVNNFTNSANAVVSSAGSLSIAANQITNAGTMMANNSLNLAATNIINNSGVMQAAQAASLAAAQILNSGTISSINNNVSAITASLQNSNLIQALNGSVFVRNDLGSALNINNALGKIIAKNEAVFEVLNGTADLTLKGGLIKSNTITLNALNADLDVKVLELNGGVIANAHNITLVTEQGNLNIISINAGTGGSSPPPPPPSSQTFIALDGDLNLGPLFFDGSNYNPNYSTIENFTAIAARDIISTADNKAVGESINTNGANVVLKAGWDYNAGKATESGGSIRLPNISFDTDGGSFEACAYKTSANFTGTIDLGNVDTSASSPGKSAGSVTIKGAMHVATGNITANGANGADGGNGGNGGNISISSQTGAVSTGSILSKGGDGSDSGVFIGGGLGGKSVVFGNGGAGGNGGDILINARTLVSVASAQSIAGNGGDAHSHGVGNPHRGNGGNGGKGGSVTMLSSNGSMKFEGPVGSQGGSGGDGLLGGTGGDAGNVTLSARLDIINGTKTDIFAVGGQAGMGKSGYNARGGNGGNVTLSTLTGIYLNQETDIATNGYGIGQHAGNISLSARGYYPIYVIQNEELPWADVLPAGTITASGNISNSGAGIQIYPYPYPYPIDPIRPMPPYARGGTIVVGNLDASGRLGADGGKVSSSSGNLRVGSGDGKSASIDVSSYSGLNRSEYGKGNAGSISISTTSGNRFVIGATPKINGSAGMLLANGFNGGRIELRNSGGQHVLSGSGIVANGTDGKGGNILFASNYPWRFPTPRPMPYPYDEPHIMNAEGPDAIAMSLRPGEVYNPKLPLDTIIDGFVQATNNKNDSGRIAFHSGAGQDLKISGSGQLYAGEFVSIGNVNQSTLDLATPQAGVLSPYPPFALLVVHGAVKCNAGNCGAVAEVKALGVAEALNNKKDLPYTLPTFADVYTAVDTDKLAHNSSNQLPGTDLVNRHISLNQNSDGDDNGSGSSNNNNGNKDGNSSEKNHNISFDTESEDSESEFLPISKTEPSFVNSNAAITASASNMNLLSFKNGEARYLSGQATLAASPDQRLPIKLKNGDALFTATDTDCKILAGNCRIELRKGSVVLLSVSNKLVKVQNVHESALGAVTVHFAGHNASISAGEEIVVGDSEARVKSAMQSDLLGRRKTQTVGKNNFSVSKGEFSIASLMQNTALLRRIYLSPEKADKQLISKIMKMHACLNQVTSSHGIFRPFSD